MKVVEKTSCLWKTDDIEGVIVSPAVCDVNLVATIAAVVIKTGQQNVFNLF